MDLKKIDNSLCLSGPLIVISSFFFMWYMLGSTNTYIVKPCPVGHDTSICGIPILYTTFQNFPCVDTSYHVAPVLVCPCQAHVNQLFFEAPRSPLTLSNKILILLNYIIMIYCVPIKVEWAMEHH